MANIRQNVRSTYHQQFGSQSNPIEVKSPGRVNIIGEHTDYNNGFVLPAAIDKAVYIALGPRTDNEIHLYALDMQEQYRTTVQELVPGKHKGWPAYILGAAAQFAARGITLRGFNAVLSSDVPIGAGLSSSAAVECATVFALNELWQAGLSRLQMVAMAQKAEHEYAGVLCGIMDQFASMMGKKNHVIKLDCRSLQYEHVPFEPGAYQLLLLNTNVKHSLASSEYNTRRQECEQAVQWVKEKYPQVQSLRDADMDMLNQCVLQKDERIYRRSSFVVQECSRLLQACQNLQQGNLAALGQLMYATHNGLSKDYEVSCPELDWLVQYVKPNTDVAGARMMGGGFSGCTINLIKSNAIEPLLEQIQPAYQAAMGKELSYYIATIDEGTTLL